MDTTSITITEANKRIVLYNCYPNGKNKITITQENNHIKIMKTYGG
jgi:hypothetical protein